MGIEKGLKRISHDPDTVDQIRKYVPLMLNGIEHINSVISGLLAFARRDAVVVTDVDLDRLIDHALVLVHHRLEDSDIIVQRETETEKGKLVRADPQCLSQVLVNLVLNAIDAMPDGGKLNIHSLSENGFVWVEVQDTGTGIPATDLTRIWDPFFTTKPPGKGTGLGLAVVRSLVEAEGGEIQIESRTGRGSLFRFSVPVAEGQA
jgi:two-component system sensor histidine kinase HydH